MSEQVRVATWNVNWFTRSAASHRSKVAFMAEQSWDVLALQEVTDGLQEAIRDAGIAEVVAFPAPSDERFTSGLIARNGFVLSQISLLGQSPQPRRGLWAHAQVNGFGFDVLSWHAPNAANRENRPVKRAGYMAFVEWCGGRRGPLVVGTDANHGSFYVREEDFPGSPFKLDFPHDEWWEENQFWTQADPDLRDVWIQYLDDHPQVLAEIRAGWTGGPSAVSYTRGSRKRPVPDRFDYVLASPEFSVCSVTYDYEGGCSAGSDHAFLAANLTLE